MPHISSDASSGNWVDIDISSTDHVLAPPGRGFYVGGTGNVVVRERGKTVDTTWTAVAAGTVLPVQVVVVRKTGTTATLMKAGT